MNVAGGGHPGGWTIHGFTKCSLRNILPYAHVVVYVGPRERNGETIHEVVHVAKSNWRGLVVAGISKVDVMTVIKPGDMVFLGHTIKDCQFSGNVRKKIAERAIACAEKPNLLFAYDHRYHMN